MKKHGALWWIFIGWWWWPTRAIWYDLPKFIIRSAKKAEKPQAVKYEAPPGVPVAPAAPVTPAAPVAPAPKPSAEAKTYKVAGVTQYTDNIVALGWENDDYSLSKKAIINEGLEDTRIWEYTFYQQKAELVPEPDNPHDPNAIKVLVGGLHVGYIKAGSCAHVLRLLREDRIEKITAEIGGGRYKIVELANCTESGEEVYEMSRGEINLYVHLSIVEKE